MKRTILITLFCISLLRMCYSQTYFSDRYNLFNLNNLTQQFFFDRDTFYLSTSLLGDSSGVISRIFLDGNIIPTNRFPGFSGKYFQPYSTCKVGNSFYSTGSGGYNNTIISPFFKFNKKCDTISTKFIGDSSYYFLMQRIMPSAIANDRLLLIGVTDSTCGAGHQGSYKPIIRVVDTNGILLKTKVYLTTCEYRNVTGLERIENKGYLIGFCSTFGAWGFESRVLKIDSNLNLVWDYKITDTNSGYMGIVNDNQNYYVATTIVDSVWNFTYKWERPSITKLDANGNIIWQKYYGNKQVGLNVTGLKKTINGDFILGGSRISSNNQIKGYIIRTDSLGNLKWWKDFQPNTMPLDTIAENYLFDIIELPTKDIAAVGWAGQSSISLLQQTWLLKVDSNGCFGAGNCPPNFFAGIEENGISNVGLIVYPNPFKDELNINYTIINFEGAAQLQLIELASGRIIDNIELTQSFGTKQFNTQNIANGFYVLSLKQSNKPSVNYKVINIK